MRVDEAWGFICWLFEHNNKVQLSALTDKRRQALEKYPKAFQRVMFDAGYLLCPECGEDNVQVFAGENNRRQGECYECGLVSFTEEDFIAYKVNEDWLQAQLRLALRISSRDGVLKLTDDIWRLGNARSNPVVLARSLGLIWHNPAILDRVRVRGTTLQLITPTNPGVQGLPLGFEVDWMPLQERFLFHGQQISTIGSVAEATSSRNLLDETEPVFGPFSEDFNWVTLPAVSSEPVKLTPMQAKLFQVLWKNRAMPLRAEAIMIAAGSKGSRPNDLFKGKKYQLCREVFATLVDVKRNEGTYQLLWSE